MRNKFGHWVPTGTVFILAITLAAGLSVETVVAQPAQGPGVAVVDFYAPSPLPPVGAIIPEELAADVLASLLTQSARQQFAVLPRADVRQAASAIGWKGSDVLRYARLQELARRLNANRIVIGWIQRLEVDQGARGGGARDGGGGRNMVTAFATVNVQVFDVKQGGIVSQVQEGGYEMGVVRARVAEQLLRRILERALPSVLQGLVSGDR
jgi:Curli production assembly/transport component CsgG